MLPPNWESPLLPMAALPNRSNRAAVDLALNPRFSLDALPGAVHIHTWNHSIMKRLRLALLIAGAIALSQLPASANDIEFGGVTIPSQQTLSPATHDDIAFRPACSQLVPIQQGEWVFWTVTLSDGEQRTLQTFPPMTTEDAYLYLDAHGLCKLGGVEVPLLFTAQVPHRQVAQFSVTPTGGDVSNAGSVVQTVTPQSPSAGPWLTIVLCAVVLMIVVLLLAQMYRGSGRRPAKPSQPPKPTQQDATAVLADLFGGNKDA